MSAVNGIAIIGMAGRLPGADDVDAFWSLLREGRESVQFFTDGELTAAGVPEDLSSAANYVKASTVLRDVEMFDASFFDIPQREAMVLDPQHRLFLECCWQAFEYAGYVSDRLLGPAGVFAGASLNSYLIHNLACNPLFLTTAAGFQALIGNEKDYLATRVAYKLNLRGPAITVQTACSTSLVAVHLACQSLSLGECDVALAGGVSVKVPHTAGYLHQEGLPFASDGHCRAFDARSSGTVFGSGVGVVLLKRLEDALADNDNVLAVIRASSINNDGSAKVGFTAPSGRGQSDVIAQTLAVADVPPETIGYVEAHGTGTPLGDPIEIQALTQAFGAGTASRGYCAIGSVKSNVGHLETASGVASLLKVVQMLRHRQLVPSINFDTPNAEISFTESPFYVNRETREWPNGDGHPRRAAVSSFGMGGTNVHAILEEALQREEKVAVDGQYAVMTLSARTREGLEQATTELRKWLERHPEADCGRVAATLQLGRKAFEYRRALVCRDCADAATLLAREGGHLLTHQVMGRREVAFLFPGGGAQHPGMAGDLYRSHRPFAAEVDRCAQQLEPLLGCDIRQFILAAPDDLAVARRLQDPEMMFPALFTVQYAMAQQFVRLGVRPHALLGHSNGEFVAATLAEVMDLDTALRIVALRSQLMMRMTPGSMLALPLPVAEVEPLVAGAGVSIAAENGPKNTVVSGGTAAITALRTRLEREHGLAPKEVHVNAALHSHFTEGIRGEFEAALAGMALHPPRTPFVSSVTGRWITPEEATDPGYWGRHLSQTVRFRPALETLTAADTPVLLDVGPNQVVTALARQNMGARRWEVVSAARGWDHDRDDQAQLAEAFARLWLLGAPIEWRGGYERRPRPLPLPTYPFQRKRYWVDPPAERGARPVAVAEMLEEMAEAQPQAAKLPGRPALMVEYVAPADAREARVAEVWQRFLGFEHIGVHDNFIELGGTSLLATEVTNALKQMFGVDLSLNAFLKSGTVRALGQVIADLEAKRDAAIAEDVLSLVADLPEEEVARMLAAPAAGVAGAPFHDEISAREQPAPMGTRTPIREGERT